MLMSLKIMGDPDPERILPCSKEIHTVSEYHCFILLGIFTVNILRSLLYHKMALNGL